MVQLRNRGQAANYRVDVSDAEGESESEENVTVKRTQPARRAAAAKAPANVIESAREEYLLAHFFASREIRFVCGRQRS